MSDMTKVDKNFVVNTTIQKEDIAFYDPQKAPFEINGVYFEDGQYRRLPESVAKATSGAVLALHAHTAGGRIRFRTDSPYIVIHAKMKRLSKFPHFSFTGAIGFDLYALTDDGWFCKSFVPPFNITDGYESVIDLPYGGMKEILIHFPTCSEVCEVYVGLSDGATAEPPTPYAVQTPVVFYGSSITQGACASRPGNAYQSMLSRRLNFDFINLGFSGSAKAERAISEYVCGLNMKAFVYDYDHNAPNPAYLEQTHERMFLEVRAAHPDLPIVLMSRPRYVLNEEEKARREVVKTTYENAKARGDQNVYFIDGQILMAIAKEDGLVDAVHPNDLGFYSMAAALEPILKTILKG